ncbi:peptidoglycan binding domain-containing protein [Kitasatospora sp. NPDC004745]|uniref:peptidoglycan binding domain-containing protein n=1 Tax=Kitasatospora sp. NPDC004745 TaxID=3364019 RepID=UPI00369385F2
MSSRESDNAHPTPRRTGPDAYPSGTPPYGTPGLPGGDRAAAAQGAASGAEDDGPKTETTLTTRVRINIPGSRPIPPVVVRSTVKNEDGGSGEDAPAAAEPGGPRHRSAPASPVLGVMEGDTRTATPPNLPPEWQIPPIPPATSESESTGAWFRPRQKKAGEPAPAAVAAGAPGTAEAPAAPAGAEPRAKAAPAAAARPGGSRPAAAQGAARPNGRPVPAQASNPAGPQAPAEEPGVYEAAAPVADPFAPAAPEAGARGQRGARPQNGAQPNGARPNGTQPNGARPNGAPRGGRPAGGPQQGPRPGAHPQGPAAGEANPEDTSVDGFRPVRENTPPPGAISGLPQNGAAHGGETRPQPGLFASAPAGADPFATKRPGQDAFAPQHPGQDAFAAPAPGGLFPGAPGAAPGRPQQAGQDPEATEFTPLPTPGPRPDGAQPHPAQGRPAPDGPAAAKPAPQPAKAEPAKGKRGGSGKKLVKLAVYGVGGVLFLGAAAYGTGLMLNQSDIPKGTVVLGTDIGGSSRDQAIHQLDETVGKAGQQPLKLKVGDQVLDLDPTVAGLAFDTTGTVDGLAQHSYNPVDVIKSLQGGTKAVAPEVKVDRAKLKAALDTLAAGSGSGLQEGYVKFADNGDPVVVPGRAGQAVDSASALDVVEQAYRDRAAGKPDQPVALAVTAAQPKTSAQALQAAADSLGKSAVNGNIHVLVGVKKWDFGPKSAAKALTLVPDASGKIVPKWDLDALKAQLDGVFDKVKVKKNGQTAVLTPQDVADALTPLLEKSGDKDRTFKFTAA